MTITTERPATTTRPTRVRPPRRTRRPAFVTTPHVAELTYETARQHPDGSLTWTFHGSRIARVAAADQATADFLPYTKTAAELAAVPTDIDYTDVAVCRISVAVADDQGNVYTSYALYHPELTRNS